MVRLNFADKSTNKFLSQYYSSLNDVWKRTQLALKKITELPLLKKVGLQKNSNIEVLRAVGCC